MNHHYQSLGEVNTLVQKVLMIYLEYAVIPPCTLEGRLYPDLPLICLVKGNPTSTEYTNPEVAQIIYQEPKSLKALWAGVHYTLDLAERYNLC